MLKTIAGTYQNGCIQFTEIPPEVTDSTPVLITFVNSDHLDPAQLRMLIDQLETIAGLQQGFNELNAGKTRSIADFDQAMQLKYDIPG